INELDEVVVALVDARLLLVLPNEPGAEPLALVKVAVAAQSTVSHKGAVGLLDEELEAERSAVDPGAGVVGSTGGVAGLAIDLVGKRLGQGKAVMVLVDQVDRRHARQGMVLVETDLAAGVARRDLDEVE